MDTNTLPSSGAPDSELPLVSVVLPTYGRDRSHLDMAVESVVAQTYKNLELLVVDDSSGGVSRHVEAEYADAVGRLRCLRGDDHAGAAAARNTGIEAAEGKYVAFLDDDDQWHPEKVARQVNTFESASPRVGVVYTGARLIRDGETIRVGRPTLGGDVLVDLFNGESLGPFSTVMVRRSAIEDAGPIDERLHFLEDREWYLRLARHHEFRPIHEPLVLRRTGEYEQLTDDYWTLRDVTYPVFLNEHRPVAAEHGAGYERRLIGTLSRTVTNAALDAGRYGDARVFALRALTCYPSDWVLLGYLVAALGGPRAHHAMRTLNRGLNRLSALGDRLSRLLNGSEPGD